ncbi:RND family transporter [Fibrobacterota bacterium]
MSKKRRVVFNAVIKALNRYLSFAERRPLVVLLFAALIGLSAVFPIRNLRIDADLDDLLPPDSKTVQAMRKVQNRFGSADLFTIAIQMADQSGNAAEIASIQDELARRMETWDDLIYVQYEQDNSFFLNHALLYLPLPHLQKIVDNLEEIQLETGTAKSPFVVDLLDDADAGASGPPGARTWFDASLPRELGLPDEAAEAFSGFLKNAKRTDTVKTWDPKQGFPENIRKRFIGRHPDGTLNGVVRAALKKSSSDTRYVKEVLVRTEKMLAPVRARYGDRLNIGVEGSYEGLQEVQSLARNGFIATSISAFLVIAAILVFFRSFGAFLAVVIQVSYSCLLTLAGAGLIYGRLNLYTMFVISVILGMGIDYSIHLMGHFQMSAASGMPWKHAMKETYSKLIRPMLLAAVTTIAGLLALLTAKFIGFYEFGVIAALGIVFNLASALFLLPALVFFFNRAGNIRYLSWLRLRPGQRPSRVWTVFNTPRGLRVLGFCALLLIAGSFTSAVFLPRTGFEYNFRNLRDEYKGRDSGRHVSVALSGGRKSSQPVVALAETPAAMLALHDTLTHRLTAEKDSMLRGFLTPYTFVPNSKLQSQRMKVIKKINALITARMFDKAGPEDLRMVEMLRGMAEVKPFTEKDIPDWAFRLLQERDGSYGKIAFIYGKFDSEDAREAARFHQLYGRFHLQGEELELFSSSFIYSDIMELVKSDAKKMAWLTSLVIFLTLVFSLRQWKPVAIACAVMILGAIWTVGLMGMFGVKLGPFNLIVITSLLGVSIDSIIYLITACRERGRDGLGEVYSVTGVLVSASVITTVFGYAGMLFTSHKGIVSIGSLAVTGFCAFYVTAMVLTPWLCLKLKLNAG